MRHIARIMRVLNNGVVVVTVTPLTGGLWGLCDFSDKELFVRKSLSPNNQIKTLIHECLHYLNPNKDERWVLKTEYEVYHDLTKAEHEYLKEYLRRLIWLSKK